MISYTQSYTKLTLKTHHHAKAKHATGRHTRALIKSNKRQFMTYVQFHTIPSLDQGKRKRRIHKVKERTQAKIIKESESALLPMPSTEPSATGLLIEAAAPVSASSNMKARAVPGIREYSWLRQCAKTERRSSLGRVSWPKMCNAPS